MAIDFPNSPTNGQIFTVGSITWVWNSTKAVWETVAGTGPQGAQGPQGATGTINIEDDNAIIALRVFA
jgi:hypothetical protein